MAGNEKRALEKIAADGNDADGSVHVALLGSRDSCASTRQCGRSGRKSDAGPRELHNGPVVGVWDRDGNPGSGADSNRGRGKERRDEFLSVPRWGGKRVEGAGVDVDDGDHFRLRVFVPVARSAGQISGQLMGADGNQRALDRRGEVYRGSERKAGSAALTGPEGKDSKAKLVGEHAVRRWTTEHDETANVWVDGRYDFLVPHVCAQKPSVMGCADDAGHPDGNQPRRVSGR